MGKSKIKAQSLLQGDTLRLFFVSALGFVLRYGFAASLSAGIYFFLKSGLMSAAAERYGSAVVYAVFALSIAALSFLLLLFCSGVRFGEQTVYLMRCESFRGRTGLLFYYLSPRKSFRAFRLYSYCAVLKLIWSICFAAPPVLVLGVAFGFRSAGVLSRNTFNILIGAVCILSAVSVTAFLKITRRYAAAPLFAALNSDIGVLEAVRKSVEATDGCLEKLFRLWLSFFGWFMLCILVFPAFYAVPYYKLSKCLTVTEWKNEYKEEKPSRYTVRLLHLESVSDSE